MLIAWLGFAGSWLLVAGPLYQGVIEFREQEVDREDFDEAIHGVTPSQPPSSWWWLLPPVMLSLRRLRNEAYRREVRARFTPEQQGQFYGIFEKATGWFVVAFGALLLAIKETRDLHDGYDWPLWSFVALVVVALALCVFSAFTQLIRQHSQ